MGMIIFVSIVGLIIFFGDFPRKCVTAYNPTRRISNERQQIKRFSHANGQ